MVPDYCSQSFLILTVLWGLCAGGEEQRWKVEGRAFVPGLRTDQWVPSARVLLDGDQHIGFIRLDGSFTVNDVSSGSYVVHIIHPTYRFEPVRVDINAVGKMRARRVNYIKPSEVEQLPYPLLLRCSGYHSYFIERDTWVWSDFIMNPMVLMMVFPVVIIILLPKLINMNDPGMRKEMEQSMNMLNPNPELPDVSEIMTKFFAQPKSRSKSETGAHKGHRGGSGGPRRKSHSSVPKDT